MNDALKAMLEESESALDAAYDMQEAEDAAADTDGFEDDSSEFDHVHTSGEEGAVVTDEGAQAPLDEDDDTSDEVSATDGLTGDVPENQGMNDQGADAGDTAGGAAEVAPPSWKKHSELRRSNRKLQRRLGGADKTIEQLRAENEALKRVAEQGGLSVDLATNGFGQAQVDKLRDEYGDDLANTFESLARAAGVYGDNNSAGDGVAATAATGDQGVSDAPVYESFGDLLDAAPDDAPIQQIGIWADSADPTDRAMYARAQAVQNQMSQDPAFAGLDVVSFYNEVAKRTMNAPAPTFVNDDSGVSAVVTAVAAPPVKKRVPPSLSAAPASAHADSTGLGAVHAMTPKQLEKWRKEATADQLAALDEALWG